MPKGKTTPDRTSFLNATKSAAFTEAIKKEERSLYKLFQKQIELRHLCLPRELTGKPSGKQPIAEVKVDSDLVARLAHQGRLVSTIETKCISKEYLRDISRSTWSIANPGYINHDSHYQSASKTDYAWSEAEVTKMIVEGELEFKHHRKRDEFSDYAEATFKNIYLRR